MVVVSQIGKQTLDTWAYGFFRMTSLTRDSYTTFTVSFPTELDVSSIFTQGPLRSFVSQSI